MDSGNIMWFMQNKLEGADSKFGNQLNKNHQIDDLDLNLNMRTIDHPINLTFAGSDLEEDTKVFL